MCQERRLSSGQETSIRGETGGYKTSDQDMENNPIFIMLRNWGISHKTRTNDTDLDLQHDGCESEGATRGDAETSMERCGEDESVLYEDGSDILYIRRGRRIVHLIVPLRPSERSDKDVTNLFQGVCKSSSSSVIIISIHFVDGNHLHIVHGCAYVNGQCRCG